MVMFVQATQCYRTFQSIVVCREAAKAKLRTGLNGRLGAAEEEKVEPFAVTRAELLRGTHETTVVAVANGDTRQ